MDKNKGIRSPSAEGAIHKEARKTLSKLRYCRFLDPDGRPKPSWLLSSTREEALAAMESSCGELNGGFKGAGTHLEKLSSIRRQKKELQLDNQLIIPIIKHDFPKAFTEDNAVMDVIAEDFSRDLALLIRVEAALKLGLKARESVVNFVRSKFSVWKKGYGCCGDVDGNLYVYERIGSLDGNRTGKLMRR